MRQFFETYKDDKKVSPLVTQLPWTHNLLILSRSKQSEEREFYLRLALQERWTKRELERQLNGALFERVVLSPAKVSPPLTQLHPDASVVFKDAYLLDFLDLPAQHSEPELQKALVVNMRHFLLELGGDFTFVGENSSTGQEAVANQAPRILRNGGIASRNHRSRRNCAAAHSKIAGPQNTEKSP